MYDTTRARAVHTKFHPRTSHEGPDGKQRYSSILSSVSLLDLVLVFNATLQPLYHQERDPVPVVQGDGRAPGPVWVAAQKLVHTGIRSPDREARTQYNFPAHSNYALLRFLFPAVAILFLLVPQSQQASGRKLTRQTARLLGAAYIRFSAVFYNSKKSVILFRNCE